MESSKYVIPKPAGFLEPKSELITPAIASEMLRNNICNRPLMGRHVMLLRREMQAGQFHGEVSTIIIDNNGNLVDGQHRLEAIAKSGQSQWMQVIRGVPPSYRKFIDRVLRPRTAGNVLHMEGYKHSNTMAAGISIMNHFSRDGRYRQVKESMTPGDYDDYVMAFPMLEWWAGRAAIFCRNPSLAPSGIICGLGVLFELSEPSASDAEEFFSQLRSGVGLAEDTHLLGLRNRLIKNSAERKENRLSPYYVGWLIIKTWNKIVQGKPFKKLALRPDEAPPTIAGFEASLLPNYRRG